MALFDPFFEWKSRRALELRDARGRGFVKVLGLETRLGGDDGYELYRLGVVRERFRYPVIEVEMRVGMTEPVPWCEPAPEAMAEAARLLLGLKKPPWWKSWWASEVEKARGYGWRVRS
jgi:hypothetical protein